MTHNNYHITRICWVILGVNSTSIIFYFLASIPLDDPDLTLLWRRCATRGHCNFMATEWRRRGTPLDSESLAKCETNVGDEARHQPPNNERKERKNNFLITGVEKSWVGGVKGQKQVFGVGLKSLRKDMIASPFSASWRTPALSSLPFIDLWRKNLWFVCWWTLELCASLLSPSNAEKMFEYTCHKLDSGAPCCDLDLTWKLLSQLWLSSTTPHLQRNARNISPESQWASTITWKS